MLSIEAVESGLVGLVPVFLLFDVNSAVFAIASAAAFANVAAVCIVTNVALLTVTGCAMGCSS